MFVIKRGAVADVESSPESRRRAAAALIKTHDAVFRKTARRYSICGDDAEDAYQRALEILLTKAPPIEGDSLVRWMQTVTKREALGVRGQRERMLSAPRSPDAEDDRDPLDSIASEQPEPDERVASRERVARSSEALRALKPQEVRALTLKAEGYSYAEIGEITGWTYTKINRCMAEGRKRFIEVFDELEHGDRCEDISSALSAMADGEREVSGADAVQVHLRSCATCRAKLRAFRAVPDRVLELMPLGGIDATTKGHASQWIADRFTSATEKARELGYSVMTRGTSDAPASQVATAGGTRGAGSVALAKVLAVCVGGSAAAGVCVQQDVVDLPGAGANNPVAEQPSEETEVPEAVSDTPAATILPEQPAPAPSEPETPPNEPQNTPQQIDKEVGIGDVAAQPVQPSSSPPAATGGGTEFGGAASGGGGSSGGGGGGFGFEK